MLLFSNFSVPDSHARHEVANSLPMTDTEGMWVAIARTIIWQLGSLESVQNTVTGYENNLHSGQTDM